MGDWLGQFDPTPPASRAHSHGVDYAITWGWSVFTNVVITFAILKITGVL